MAEPVVTEDLEKQSLMTTPKPALALDFQFHEFLYCVKQFELCFFATCNIQYSMLYSYYLLKVYYVLRIIMRASIKTNSHNHIFLNCGKICIT